MDVYLDGRRLTVGRPTLAGALAAGREAAASAGRVVVEATLGGEPIPDGMLDDPPDRDAGPVEVRFVSADPAQLVLGTLTDVAQTLGDVMDEQGAAADLIRLGKVDQAFEHIASSLRTWDGVRQVVVHGATLLGIPLETTTVWIAGQGVPITDCVESLAVQLREIKRSIEAQDWSALADVLDHDMKMQADRWQDLLRGLADQIRTRRPSPSARA